MLYSTDVILSFISKYVHNCTNNIAHSLKCNSSITSAVISLYHSAVEVYTHHSTVGNVTWMQKTASQTHATLYMLESAGFTSFGCKLLYQSQTKLYYNSANPGMTSLTHSLTHSQISIFTMVTSIDLLWIWWLWCDSQTKGLMCYDFTTDLTNHRTGTHKLYL